MNLAMMLTLFLSTIFSCSSNSWFMIWLFMEINTLSFISILNKFNNTNKSEALMKYFLIQSIAAILILFSFLALNNNNMEFNSNENTKGKMLMLFGILLKLGLIPLHMWMPPLLKQIGWFSTFLLLTWQKIIPLYLMTFFVINNNSIMMMILISLALATLFQIYSNSIKNLITFSSISHMSWTSALSFISPFLMTVYLLTYSLILYQITKYIKLFQFNFLNNMMPSKKKLMFIMLLLSLGGIPPLLGFLPKWMTLTLLMETQTLFIPLIFTTMASLNFYIYLRFSFNMLYTNNDLLNYQNKTYNDPMLIISQAFLPLTFTLK